MKPKNIIVILWYLSLGVLVLFGKTGGDDPINLKSNIVYKTTSEGDLSLDLYYPEKKLSGKYPLVIYTHGGGWAQGSKMSARARSKMSLVVRSLTEHGMCVASINYRLCRKGRSTRIRDCVIDCKDAARYLAKNSEALFVDSNRVFTFGDSAGGQIAHMLLLSPPKCLQGVKKLANFDYTVLGGVSWYGPCDFEKIQLFNPDGRPKFHDRFKSRILPSNTPVADKLKLYREISPVTYLGKDSPPLLMIQGDKDTTIPVHHAHYMKAHAEKIGAPVEIVIVRNAGHNWRSVNGAIDPGIDTIIMRTVSFITNLLENNP